MNIARSFVTWMEDEGFGTFGTDIYIGIVPQDAPDTCWWITTSGGTLGDKNETGELQKNYVLDLFYRSTDAETVYDDLQTLEIAVNADPCTQLTGFDTIDLEAAFFPADQDIDTEQRTVGLLQITIRTYYKE